MESERDELTIVDEDAQRRREQRHSEQFTQAGSKALSVLLGDQGAMTQQASSELTLADIDAAIAAFPDEPRAQVTYDALFDLISDGRITHVSMPAPIIDEHWEHWDAVNRRIAAVVNRSYQRRGARQAQARRMQRLVRRQRRSQQRKHEQGKQQ